MEATASQAHAAVRDYYGQTLQSTSDLKTTACCSDQAVPDYHKPILSLLADEVMSKFYGCGSPIPPALEGMTVLDLGCGTGRDAFVAAKLAGETGHVIGIDMTEAQIEVARRYEAQHAEVFGFTEPTTSFRLGVIEDLAASGIESESVDVVISNCVLNLSPDKEQVFAELTRALRPGGELYVSDVFCDRRLSPEIQADPVLLGECLGGALYTEDFRRMMRQLGWADVRTVMESPIEVTDPVLRRQLGNAQFVSRTIRAFKLPDAIEGTCEDYGQVAIYRGGIEGMEHAFVLDDHHTFEAGRPMLVCGNSAAMIQETRFGRYFDVLGDRSTHFGAFDCAPAAEDKTVRSSCC
ncbi:MAG: methyltransferase domain-containing protein [Rubricoccaceae bacterium]